MKVGIYIRVSTDEQAKEGYSISGQLQKMKAFCISQNWSVEGVYADEGLSAKDLNRPELQRLIEDVESEDINCVLVYRLDRLTRSVFDLYKLLERFDKYGCKFKSATEVYDTTTAMGRMFITIVAALAQWERENMGERISFGNVEKARQGKIPLTFAPIGYDLNREESKLHINKQEAIVVRTIFQKYIEGLGSNRLCTYLNSRNMLTKKGNKWSQDTIFKVINSPLHKGSFSWSGTLYEDTHDPIVTKETWNRAQEIRKDRSEGKRTGRAVSSNFLFSSVVPCESCGKSLSGNYTQYKKSDGEIVRYNFYRCRYKLAGSCDSEFSSVSEKLLEEEFLNKIKNFSFDHRLSNAVNVISEEPDINQDKEELIKKLNKLEARKKKWQYAWSDDLISHEDFKKRMDEADESIIEVNILMKEYEEPEEEQGFTSEEITLALKGIEENWHVLSSLEKKNLIYNIVDELKIERTIQQTTNATHVKITDIVFK